MIAWLKKYASHLLGLIATLLAAFAIAKAPPALMGDAGPQFTGEQHYGADMRLYEAANNAQSVAIAAGACTNIDYTPVMASGEYDTLWAGVIFDYDHVDAGTNCDGGGCSAFLTSMLPVDSHGGGFCQMGGAACTNTDGGGLDTPLLSFPPGNATLYGGTEHLVVNTATGSLALQACCGSRPCRARGRISGTRGTPFASSSGGSSSGGSSSSSSSGAGSSSGGVPTTPTISKMVPLITAASGGLTVAVIGTNFVNGTTTFTFGTVAATSVSCAPNANYAGCSGATTCCTMTAPACQSGMTGCTSLNGTSGTAVTVSATNGGTPGTGAVALFDDGNSAPIQYVQGDVKITLSGSNVTAWGDMTAGANNWSGGTSPTQGSTGFGSHNTVVFNGTSQYLTSTFASPPAASAFSNCTTVKFAALTGGQYSIVFNGNSGAMNELTFINTATFGATYSTGFVQYISTSNASDTSSHVLCQSFANGTNVGLSCVDGTCTTGTFTVLTGNLDQTHTMGAATAANYASVTYVDEWAWPVALSSAAIGRISANAATAYGVP